MPLVCSVVIDMNIVCEHIAEFTEQVLGIRKKGMSILNPFIARSARSVRCTV